MNDFAATCSPSTYSGKNRHQQSQNLMQKRNNIYASEQSSGICETSTIDDGSVKLEANLVSTTFGASTAKNKDPTNCLNYSSNVVISHYGSTSTTFSTASTTSSIESCGGAPVLDPCDVISTSNILANVSVTDVGVELRTTTLEVADGLGSYNLRFSPIPKTRTQATNAVIAEFDTNKANFSKDSVLRSGEKMTSVIAPLSTNIVSKFINHQTFSTASDTKSGASAGFVATNAFATTASSAFQPNTTKLSLHVKDASDQISSSALRSLPIAQNIATSSNSLLTQSTASLLTLSSTSVFCNLTTKTTQQQQSSGPTVLMGFDCATMCGKFCDPLRRMVSQNRRRYQQDGFNLDLTYITDRIIAMGYPAKATEAFYRNTMAATVKFLEHYHPGHYKVFNLRGQYVYDTSKFQNRVVSFEMTDHHPPRLELMAPFCREVHDYLNADSRNVVAVHCKAGKGRTGVMICAYLCYISFYRSPRQNMDYYSIIRTHNNKGVTIPSQRRYVYYFSHLRDKKLNYIPLKTELIGIYVEKPKLNGLFLKLSKDALKVSVMNGDVEVFLGSDLCLSNDQLNEEEEMHKKFPIMTGNDQFDPDSIQPGKDCISRRCYGWTVPLERRVFLEGDVRISLVQKSKMLKVKHDQRKIGHIWFNTMFSCPGFCGGQYVHGDEAYPYSKNGEPMIVRRVLRQRSSKTTSAPSKDNDSLKNCLHHKESSTTDLPQFANHHHSNCDSLNLLKHSRRHYPYEDGDNTSIKKNSNTLQNSASPFISYGSPTFLPLKSKSNKVRISVDNVVSTKNSLKANCSINNPTQSAVQFSNSDPTYLTTVTSPFTNNASAASVFQADNSSFVSDCENAQHSIKKTSVESDTVSNTSSFSISSSSLSEASCNSSVAPFCTVVDCSCHTSATTSEANSIDPHLPEKCSKRVNGIESSPTFELERKCWVSQDGKIDTFFSTTTSSKTALKNSCNSLLASAKCRSSLDNDKKHYEEEIIVDDPPGLEAHCPINTLRDIYPSDRQPLRYKITEILRDAYKKNLIYDLYNTRRMSIPCTGSLMPKSPVGRPNAESQPYCVMRNPNEHVTIYGVQEIDKAYKSKDLDMAFKIFVVTRCLDESNSADIRKADDFLYDTYQKQLLIDKRKQHKMELRHKKLINSQSSVQDVASTSAMQDASFTTTITDSMTGQENNAASGGSSFLSAQNSGQTSSTTTSDSSSCSSSHYSSGASSLCLQQQIQEDPRLADRHLKKFFFRQRITSQSKHPNLHYHCPLRSINSSICAKYNCNLLFKNRSCPQSIINEGNSDRLPLDANSKAIDEFSSMIKNDNIVEMSDYADSQVIDDMGTEDEDCFKTNYGSSLVGSAGISVSTTAINIPSPYYFLSLPFNPESAVPSLSSSDLASSGIGVGSIANFSLASSSEFKTQSTAAANADTNQMMPVDLDLESLSSQDTTTTFSSDVDPDVSVGLLHDRCVTMTTKNYDSKIFR